ncbi:MAG: PP0621 family protein [Candidatus Nitrotoga sp.]
MFIAIFVIVYLLLKYYRKQRIKDGDAENKAATTAKQTEDMVRCAQCGVHLPKGESLVVSGANETKYFCSEAHRRAHSN